MSFRDLSSPRAVEQALDEFDRLGRDAFLGKYGFGRAREYFVQRDEKLYDSKAVVGAAFGYQFPERGALGPRDFSGGEATVEAKLKELGFEVEVIGRNPAIRRPPESGPSGLDRAFHSRMVDIYREAKAAGYNATRFFAMINDHGGLETARILLNASTVSEGYTALWERKRLDLTVEAVVLEPEWRELFSHGELQIAVKRLREYEYEGKLPQL